MPPTSFPAFLSETALTLAALFATANTMCVAQAPDLNSDNLWRPGSVPFSFVYHGQRSDQLLKDWQVSSALVAGTNGEVRTYSYADPQSHLVITAEVRRFPDFPNALDWVLHFRNAGSEDTEILEDILPLDWALPSSPPAECVVRHDRGSTGAATDFEPLEEHLKPGERDSFGSSGGDSSSGTSLPFFNIQIGESGIIGAIGWTGNWDANFRYEADGRALELSAGMKKTHLRLHGGEEIRSPRIVVMNWSGPDWSDSQNLWRQLLLRHYSPQEGNQPMRGPVLFGTWGSEFIQKKLADLAFVRASAIPFSVYGVDAGWFGQSSGTEKESTSPWWLNRGNWYANPTNYPQGLKPLGDQARTNGIGFSLWVEPETAMEGTQFIQSHPAWFLHTDHPKQPGASLLNLGNKAAREGITELLDGFITEFGMTWYRQDFNIEPEPYWSLADTPDRIGMTEIGHIEGLYQVLDTLLGRHPGLHIDNCASGGRRLDIEMMSRSFVVWRTDHGFADTLAEQAQTQALAPWVPETMGFEAYSLESPWLGPGPYTTPTSTYQMRLAYSAGFGMDPGAAAGSNTQWISLLKSAIQEYREVQPYFFADFYPLLPYSLGNQEWTAWQLDRPAQKDGMVILLRRPGSTQEWMSLNLKHLRMNARYQVEIREAYEHAAVKKMSGAELTSLKIQLRNAPDSCLVFYHKNK